MQKDKDVSAKDVIREKDSNLRDQKYNQYVKNITPTHNVAVNVCKAFVVGGIICCIGQAFINLYKIWFDEETAVLYEVITLVALAVIFSGFGLYAKLAKFAGAGSVVPITGFANSVAASAIEFKKEGQVFGIGCRIFNIAGPVILYGIFSSWLYGLVYWALKTFGVI